MSDITLKNMTPTQLMAFGDAALRIGDANMARGLYNSAIRAAGPKVPLALRCRVDLARHAKTRTVQMLDALEALQKIDEGVFVGEGLATWLKAPPFARDKRFMDLSDKHSGLLPLANWHWNLHTVVWAVQHARSLKGEFVELGVFRGHTTLFAAEYVGFETWDKTWTLYDTFEGIPVDQLDPGWDRTNTALYGGTFSFEEVRDRFVAFPNIRVVKGRVPEVLAGDCPDAISFIHMDLNNTTAEIQALDALFDRLTSGGVIVFDDYGWSVARRQQEAEDEWFAARGMKILSLPTGQGLFVKP